MILLHLIVNLDVIDKCMTVSKKIGCISGFLLVHESTAAFLQRPIFRVYLFYDVIAVI